jgi:2-polyprenyl-6-hydroxyphenyl methylase/3-demethylubiquinone-9 3-methyltransferase
MLRWKIAQSAEIRWWQNYLKKKDPTQYLAWKRQYWRDFLQKIYIDNVLKAGLALPLRCLDAGSSLAGIFMILEHQEVTAIDPLMDIYLEKFPQFIKKEDYPNVDFQTLKLEALAEKNAYDIVFCLNVINHVADIKTALSRLWAALRSGGEFILTVDAHNYKAFKYLFRIFQGDILHPHQYDLSEYKNMLLALAPNSEIKSQLIKKEFFFNYYLLHLRKP